MSAVVCGSKRSFFEDSPTPPSSKRIRCSPSSTSPSRSSPPPSLDKRRAASPHLENEVLLRALQGGGGDLNAAVKCLHSFEFAEEEEKAFAEELAAGVVQGGFSNEENAVAAGGNLRASDNIPRNGAGWVDLLVSEMVQSSSTDDAKDRATRVLEALEKAISDRAYEEAGKRSQEEIMGLRQQLETVIKDNAVLKRAVAIQHERQKDTDDMKRQVELLRQLIPQYQEKMRALEVNNYALRMHLQQAERSIPIPGNFRPDVF